MNLHLADEHDIVKFQKNQSNTKGSQQTITSILQCVVSHKGIKKLNICHAVAEWLSMLYSHTGHAIKEFLINKVQEFNLQNKILCIVTDNDSNMAKHQQIIHIQNLVKFFDSPKQSQRLDIIQIEAHKKKQKKIFCNNPNSSDKSENNSNFEDEEEAMKVHYAKNIDSNEYDYNNAEGLQETPNYDLESNSLDDENKNIQNIIYNSLFEYWDHLSQICLLAILLDLWLKEMTFANEETHNNTINECRFQLHQLMNIQLPISNKHATSSSSKNLSPNNMFKDLIFSNTQRSQEFTDELDFYLDFRQTPLASSDANPLLWW
ncbi:7551_t:CDS:2 [Cetraspora pellucida]|uniref:7551_t:CDS:1 n=1 Tax=Cetraspora pellucida TaxID=1433469 RepID=A0A9N9GRA9_9GLOM|nr:7551_t:CDS:2 [Cetraspora pellucida]